METIRNFCNRLAMVLILFALFISLKSFLNYQTHRMEQQAYASSQSVLARLSESPLSWQRVSVPFLSIAAAWLIILPKHCGRDAPINQLPPRPDDRDRRSRRYEIG